MMAWAGTGFGYGDCTLTFNGTNYYCTMENTTSLNSMGFVMFGSTGFEIPETLNTETRFTDIP